MAFLNIAKASTFTLNEGTQALEALGRTVYRFGFGEAPFAPPAPVQAALRNAAPRIEYTAVAGLPQLREKIASFHQEVDGYAIDAGQVLVAPGTKPLLHNIMRAFQPAAVYLPQPSWISYGPQARLAGHEVINIPTSFEGRWRITPDALEQAVARSSSPARQKLLVLNYPGNPDGLTYSPSELDALTQVLRRRRFWVISDEIYALLDHRGRHRSLASVYPERTLVTTGMSKWCGAGGWRLGALILPPDAPSALFNALVGLGSETYSCAPAPIQAAALRAYELDEQLYEFLAAQRRILRAVGAVVHAALLASGLRVHAPQGGFYLLLDFSPFSGALAAQGIIDDRQLCDRLLADAGVALLPGMAFGMPPEWYTARLAYVDFDGDAALREADQIEARATAHAAKMLEGIDALGEWLRQLNSSR
ncbi:MAG: aminotransferase class I/II-fold pyridoxal phosphate-dependent enzyme [Chloroflexota bacterium]|nr:aminotransferase class I/II-fold pyridoxal phosphate-dependent enzyme [Chloroflexota bacterium]MDE2946880.1 aminotransferase class I/II-fold pyridoxal phosphate-dependent enzyme [Chloroflexota bacterium]